MCLNGGIFIMLLIIMVVPNTGLVGSLLKHCGHDNNEKTYSHV